MDLDRYFSKTRGDIINTLHKETVNRSIRFQATTWIRFIKDQEYIDLTFNSRMTLVYNLNDIDEIVGSMIGHMAQQVENPALTDSKFAFDKVM